MGVDGGRPGRVRFAARFWLDCPSRIDFPVSKNLYSLLEHQHKDQRGRDETNIMARCRHSRFHGLVFMYFRIRNGVVATAIA